MAKENVARVGSKSILSGDLNAKHVTWNAKKNDAFGQVPKYYYKNSYVLCA
jgi:hypothetical protein